MTALIHVALLGLIVAPGIAVSGWDCRPDPGNGGWICDEVSPQPADAAPTSIAPPATPPAESPGIQPDTPTMAPEPGDPEPPVGRDTDATEGVAPDAVAPLAPAAATAATTPPAAQAGATTPSQPEGPVGSPEAVDTQRVTTADKAPTTATEDAAPPADEVAQPTAAEAISDVENGEPPAGDMTAPTADVVTDRDGEAASKGLAAETATDPLTATRDATTSTAESTETDGLSAAPEMVPLSTDIDEGIDWSLCSATARRARGGYAFDEDAASLATIEIGADDMLVEPETETASFSGNVQLAQGPVRMRADELVINQSTGIVDADGNVVIVRPDIRVSGSSVEYDTGTKLGSVENASFRVPEQRARGDADSGRLTGEGLSEYQNISYTTCAPGRSDWLLSAEDLELDRNEGLGTAYDATLRFMNVPVAYAPKYTFPIDDRRRSGFLLPSIGNSNRSGFQVSIPYYFNLAPNYDLTLEPRIMSKRGLQIGGEFRYLTEKTNGTLLAEIIPDDQEYEEGSSTRGGFAWNSQTIFNERLIGNARVAHVSDEQYLEDLGRNLAVTSTRELERAGELIYLGDTWQLLGRVQDYQTIDEAVPLTLRPYSRLPQLLFTLRDSDGPADTTLHLDAEYVHFDRDDSVTGERLDLYPAVSLPLRNVWGYVTPKAGARVTSYQLTDQKPGLSDSPSHATGIFSVDSGMFFERYVDYLDNASIQTLEPRLFYLYVPSSNQDDQPIFDTTEFDTSFDNLFRENRFNGPDRIGDANQLSLALTSRVISDESGQELIRASIGQIYYFQDREVNLPRVPTQTESSSSVVGELRAELGGGWKTRAELEWDPHPGDNGRIEQALAEIRYVGDDRSLFRVQYRLRDGVLEQTDVGGILPLNERWYLIGRHNYSLLESRRLEVLGGFEYRQCCWRFRALVREFANSADDDPDLGFLVQLELNGLGRLGNDIDQLLTRSISGYRSEAYD